MTDGIDKKVEKARKEDRIRNHSGMERSGPDPEPNRRPEHAVTDRRLNALETVVNNDGKMLVDQGLKVSQLEDRLARLEQRVESQAAGHPSADNA